MYVQGDSMESSGVVTSIRETRIPNASVSEVRKKIITPNLQVASQQSGLRTREEVRAFQLTASELVASKLKEAGHNPNDVDVALEAAARDARFVADSRSPKQEFFAGLPAELLNPARMMYRAVGDSPRMR